MAETGTAQRQVAVVGAGIIGICCALYLQREGYKVRLFDPEGPAEGASKGNAGLIAQGSCVPNAQPGILWQVPHLVLDPLGPLTIRWSYLPQLLPWLLRFAAAARPARVEQLSQALYALYADPLGHFAPLIESAGAGQYIRRDGRIEVYASEKAFQKAQGKLALLQRRGVRVEVLEGDKAQEVEPELRQTPRVTLVLPDVAHTTDPYRLTLALAEDFTRQGGRLLKERVTELEPRSRGGAKVSTPNGSYTADAVVIAAGARSGALAESLGSPVPLASERGYHLMLPNPGVTLRRPVMSGDHYFAITPMAEGLRLAGTAEFAPPDAPPNWGRADKLLTAARTLFPNLNGEGATRWVGARPAIPDSLPVISASPKHPGIFFAFGHGHLGLTAGGVTGRIIADLVAGRQPVVDPTPFRVDRF